MPHPKPKSVKPKTFTGPVQRNGVINSTNYRVTAERIAGEKGGVYTNQFDNVANYLAHYNGTGPEIFRQSQGRVDAFVCASGTGGTISGVSNFLKDTNPDIKIVLADCDGSALASKVLTGKLEMVGTGSFAEGIGNSMITGNHGRAVIDDAVRVRSYFPHLLFTPSSCGSSAHAHVFAATRSSSKWVTFCSAMMLFLWVQQLLSMCALQSKWRASSVQDTMLLPSFATVVTDTFQRSASAGAFYLNACSPLWQMYNKEWLEGRNLAVKHNGLDLSFVE
jgi:hypothetical protein